MACETCRSQARTLLRVAARRTPSTTKRYASSVGPAAAARNISIGSQYPSRELQYRTFSQTAPASVMPKFSAATSGPYFVVGATERLYKVCGEAANYHITEEERNSDRVVRLDDGEEVGTSIAATSVWHKKFKLRPTFSTWSHVTMLHLYLLNARVRCFERDVYRRWQQQLIDHFFFEAEKKMHVDHHITSSALRQRYLKDIFVQWRGLLLAYDEGLIKGDAILASAVWRNLFKGDPAADPRALAAIVGWMRASLKALEATSDYTFPNRAGEVLSVPVESFWSTLEKGFNGKPQEALKGTKTVPEATAQV
uniref:Ubiquinol-cytochrome c chaperone domain-containing protein n=1 Tax=Bionectria ochroleuca TaxID=29856 RepID=A0A8H7NAZ8_BIOOC